MSYRDDREVLRQRVLDLERELAEARGRLEQTETVRSKTDRLEVELAAAQRNLERIRGELHAGRDAAPPRRRPTFAAANMILFGVIAWTAVSSLVLLRPASEGDVSTVFQFEHEGGPRAMRMAGFDEDFGRERRSSRKIKLTGTVDEVSGEAPSSLGEACKVIVRPGGGVRKTNCRAVVRCGDETLYGRNGASYAYCEFEGGRLSRVTDMGTTSEDGDPMLELDVEKGRLEVSDEGDSPYEVIVNVPKPSDQPD
jgi:hypothetical protein